MFLQPVSIWLKSRCSSTEPQKTHAHVMNNLHAVRTEISIRGIFRRNDINVTANFKGAM